ncbi:MAG: MBL fold metallo-hydrolase [Deltaproteobacteria bacterium]|nr:MBL fold metallo-hydrolase [Deltaproteobacteria bacterium]MCL5791504.1 MBL fold metallo-hydrolase [Deltaproteobacteria bacterium]
MKQLKDDTYLLESGKFVNIYAIVQGKNVLIIDTGTPGKADNMLKELAGIGIKPSDVKAVIITHAHPDHTGSCAALIDKTRAKLYVHKDDLDVLVGKSGPPRPRYLLEKLSAFMIKHVWKYKPPLDAIPVDEDSSISGFDGLKIIHTPGHTPGSISVLYERTGTLFCGDAINKRSDKLTGPIKYFTVDADQAWHSVGKIAALNFNSLCPGHGNWLYQDAQQKVHDLLTNNKPDQP